MHRKKTWLKEFHPGTNKEFWFWFSIKTFWDTIIAYISPTTLSHTHTHTGLQHRGFPVLNMNIAFKSLRRGQQDECGGWSHCSCCSVSSESLDSWDFTELHRKGSKWMWNLSVMKLTVRDSKNPRVSSLNSHEHSLEIPKAPVGADFSWIIYWVNNNGCCC